MKRQNTVLILCLLLNIAQYNLWQYIQHNFFYISESVQYLLIGTVMYNMAAFIQKNIEYRWRLNVHFELANRHYCLTEREREVLTLISEGSSNKEAANLLGISSRTVEAHRARIMKKMEVDSFVDLVMLRHFNILNERG